MDRMPGTIGFTVNGAAGACQRAADGAAVPGAARRARPHRHQGRLRCRRLRRLHGAARRRAGLRLPDRGRPGRRREVVDRRGPRRRIRIGAAAAGVPSCATAPRNAASARPACWWRRRRCWSAMPTPTETEIAGRARRRALPLHRLSQDRRGGHGRATPTASRRISPRGRPGRRRAHRAARRRGARSTAANLRRRRHARRMRCCCAPSARRITAPASRFGDLAAFVARPSGHRPGADGRATCPARNLLRRHRRPSPTSRSSPTARRASRARRSPPSSANAEAIERARPRRRSRSTWEPLAGADARSTPRWPTTRRLVMPNRARQHPDPRPRRHGAMSRRRSRRRRRRRRRLRDRLRRACLYRARSRLRAARRRPHRGRRPAPSRPTWTATTSPRSSASRRSRCASCRPRSAAASAPSSTSRCSPSSRSPPG